MKKLFTSTFLVCLLSVLFIGTTLTGCDDGNYVFQREDININVPEEGFSAYLNQPFSIEVQSASDELLTYQWFVGGVEVAQTKNFAHTFGEVGQYTVTLKVTQNAISFEYPFEVVVSYSYTLKKEDIMIEEPQDGYIATINKLFIVNVTSVSDEGVSYQWYSDDEPLTQTKNLEHMFEVGGQNNLRLTVTQGELHFDYNIIVSVEFGEITPPSEGSSPYITTVLDYMPAVGQFTNKLPVYKEGDTQKTMNEKVLAAIGNNKRGMITLGGYGGYVVVGFDHTIENVAGKRDFRVLANAFYANANPDPDAPDGGSCEPGVIMVAYDANDNGKPDENEWYEIAGSSHQDPTQELWYNKAAANGNNVNCYTDYKITYYKPEQEPTTEEEKEKYIRWEDNKGESGYKVKNIYHNQCYYPLWATGNSLSFEGTLLPQNGIDESGAGNYFVLYKFRYGYADNETNTGDESAIDISWAVNKKGQRINLPGVDFIKIYTGVNQENGWLGECSTEITSIEDLHLLGVDIDSLR